LFIALILFKDLVNLFSGKVFKSLSVRVGVTSEALVGVMLLLLEEVDKELDVLLNESVIISIISFLPSLVKPAIVTKFSSSRLFLDVSCSLLLSKEDVRALEVIEANRYFGSVLSFLICSSTFFLI
jgi:hypothetical protein